MLGIHAAYLIVMLGDRRRRLRCARSASGWSSDGRRPSTASVDPRSSVTRVLPFGSRHSVHILERNRFIFRRGWMVIFSGFFEPVFFLLGIGFGLGALIGTVTGPDGTQIPYAVFVAPALLAAASMNGAVYDSTNMFFRLRYEKAYDGMLATPMNVGDIALGEIIWALGRGALYGLGFLVVMFVFGLVPSPLGRAGTAGVDADRLRHGRGRPRGNDVHAHAGRTSTCSSSSPCRCSCSAARSSRSTRSPSRCARSSSSRRSIAASTWSAA